MEYQTTKEQCQANIDRRMPIVCTSCGGKIEPIETVDNANNPTFWQGCLSCMKFDNGTTPNVYGIAARMVDDRDFRAYSHNPKPIKDNDPLMFDYWRKSQISGTVSVVEDIIRFYNEETK